MHYEIRPMSLGEILDMGFRILRDHFSLLVGLAATIYVPLFLLGSAIVLIFPQLASPDPGAGTPWLLSFSASVGLWVLVAWPVAAAAITHAVGELYLGRAATFANSLRTGCSLVGPLSFTSLLMMLMVLGGYILLVVPGVYLGLSYVLVWPIVVLERHFGAGALRRSRELLKDNLLRVTGLVMVAGLLALALSSAVRFGVGSIPYVGLVAFALAQSIVTAFATIFRVLLYFDVRCRKEAFDIEHLARLVEQQAAPPSPAPVPIG